MVRKLILQMMDIIWVEHLEVMNYTRSSVNLRAYGQRDPLNEYRKEGNRLFREMQESTLYRIAEIIPNMQPRAIEREEEELRKEKARIERQGGTSQMSTRTSSEPRTVEKKYGRNDMVTITNGTDTKEMKYKKAEGLLNDGWKITT